MNDLENLVQDLLTDVASRHEPAPGFYDATVQRGRRLHARKRAAVSILAAVAVAGTAVAVQTLPAVGGAARSPVEVHAISTPSATASSADNRVDSPPDSRIGPATPTTSGWWSSWPPNRSYGQPADAAFVTRLAPGAKVAVYASGTLPDGQEFAWFLDSLAPGHIQWMAGGVTNSWGGESDTVAPATPFSCFETPTVGTQHGTDTAQWLVVVAEPSATAIQYTNGGTTWQPLTTRAGIGVLALPSIAPSSARVRVLVGKTVTSEGPIGPQEVGSARP